MSFYSYRVYRCARIKSVVQYLSRGKAAKPGPDKGISLTGFYVLELNDLKEIVIEIDHQTITNIRRRCHSFI